MNILLSQLEPRLEQKFGDLHRRASALETAVQGAEDELREPKRLEHQLGEMQARLDAIFPVPASTFKANREHNVSGLPEVQGLWQQGWDQATKDAQELSAAEGRLKLESVKTIEATAELSTRLARAREVHWQEPSPEPDRRQRPWLERVRRAIVAFNWRLLFDKEEVTHKEGAWHVDRFEAILDGKPSPNFKDQLKVVKDALKELDQIQQRS